MSPEAQRIAIAEACGWIIVECHRGKNIPAHLLAYERGRDCVLTDDLPDYTYDLNAMHEVEQLTLNWDEQTSTQLDTYRSWLYKLCGHDIALVPFAPAGIRAEGFLRTLGKWKDA